MSLMDLDAFRGTELVGEPYEHVIVSDFVKPDGAILGASDPRCDGSAAGV